jgi:hypothetical protein
MRFEPPFVLRASVVAQQQDQSLTHPKESLKEHEHVVLSDFAEDYSSMVKWASNTSSYCNIHVM